MPAILTTLVTGDSAWLRETAIAQALSSPLPPAATPQRMTAVILEGMLDGKTIQPLTSHAPQLLIARIAPGCICCTGNLTMRVTLNRMLRQQPQQLFISIANTSHLPGIIDFLTQEPYDKLLSLTKELTANCRSSK